MPSQFFVYPIFKNGSSSLTEYADQQLYQRLREHEISQITSEVHVYLRDARSRFRSGVNTFVQHNPDMDLRTVLTFVNRYLFLNRHFTPQFFWLINLARYLSGNVPMVLHDIDELKSITPLHSDAKILPPSAEFCEMFDGMNWDALELYYYLDQKLTDAIGSKILFPEFVEWIRQDDKILFDTVFGKSLNLTEMIRGLP